MKLERINKAVADGARVVTVRELAELLELSKARLDQLRGTSKGPRFSKVNGRITYRLEDVMRWLEGERSFASTTEASAHKAGLLRVEEPQTGRRRRKAVA
jgi:predicted transcriptional regulator of viral defense system